MVAMYEVLVQVTEAIIVTTIATAVATLAVQKTNAFLEKRKKNNHTRDEQLAHIREVFQTHLLDKVAKSQDSDYVIAEIDRLLQLSVEYFNVSNPDLHKLVSDFWFLYYKAKNYWFKVHRKKIYSGLWAGLPIIRNLLQRKMETTASVEGHAVKFCVSENRQSQGWRCENRAERGLNPFLPASPGGRGGMRAACGVNAAVSAGTQ